MEDNRPKRARRGKKAKSETVPHASYYLGYVEDGETPEMIMRKFQMLEDMQKQNQEEQPDKANKENDEEQKQVEKENEVLPNEPAQIEENNQLTIEQMEMMFNSTSYVPLSDLKNDEQIHNTDYDYMYNDDEQYNYLSDEDSIDENLDEDDEWGVIKKLQRRQQKKKQSGDDSDDDGDDGNLSNKKTLDKLKRNADKDQKRQLQQKQQQVFLNMDGRMSQVIRLKNLKDKMKNGEDVDSDSDGEFEDIKVIEVPEYPFLPPWGRAVHPMSENPELHPFHFKKCQQLRQNHPDKLEQYNRQFKVPCQTFEVADISKENIQPSKFNIEAFEGIMVNTGWETPMTIDQIVKEPKVASAKLRKINFQRLAPNGLIFVWADKPYIQPAFEFMIEQGFHYVEHLSWIFLACNNKILSTHYPFLRRAHMPMYIFRREVPGKQIDLRHQRNPDCLFDTIRKIKGRPWQIPEQVYNSIETLLPQGRGKMLELWAPKDAPRPGWIQYIEQGHDNDNTFPVKFQQENKI